MPTFVVTNSDLDLDSQEEFQNVGKQLKDIQNHAKDSVETLVTYLQSKLAGVHP